MYQVLFGEHLVQDGLQLKWLAPIDTFLELGAEIGSGAAFPGSDGDHNDPGAWAVYGHIGGDVGDGKDARVRHVSIAQRRKLSRRGKAHTGIGIAQHR
jgi:hypothetical protein